MMSLFVYVIVASLLSQHAVSTSSYTALGDSYAAGYGAGPSKWLPRPLDPLCGRTSYAYPKVVAEALGLESADVRRTFHNAACGGATTTSIMKTQLSQIKDSELVTMTVGGNEVDFFAVLNECVHQWRPIKGCEKELETTRQAIQSTTFISNYDKLIEDAVAELAPNAQMIVTGYARFFNEATEQCDNVTFSVTQPDNYLTVELRATLNSLILMLNDVIEAASAVHGAIYLDMDSIFDGHRFCEEGVDEPSEREATWFFNLDLAKWHFPDDILPDQIQKLMITGPDRNFFETTSLSSYSNSA